MLKSGQITMKGTLAMAKIRLKQFVLNKQAQEGREITIKEISEGSGVSRDTISRMMNDKVQGVDLDTVTKLCRFFDIPKGPVPFVIYDED